ncbi:type II toxin-antitoxin system RelE/ParE family toxin [Sphingomonas bacterium]|uniref:type II toxin-antitoxin system RelE/ParE family toxin n=1 Tax=Sphingomonas bacterium TaxID=1895847 RepID=UPI001576B3C4|nr:type II toxin-antitoxin system RelE/ParE family toxin [Sphingomonas bacterium]
MQLELSRRALADLDDIRDFSVERFGLVRAIAYLDAIEQAFRHVLSFPEVGPVFPSADEQTRSLAAGEHRIFYVHDAEKILVLRVLHKRMDVKRRM